VWSYRVTLLGGVADAVQQSWRDGTLAEYVLFPASTVTPLEGFEDLDMAQLAVITRCIVPFGGLLRGRLRAG
jgi:alcohol dehydrogenase